MHGRNREKAELTLKKIQRITNKNNISSVYADLSSFGQIEEMVNKIYYRYNNLDVLINNAGVYRPEHNITQEGLEETFAVNYIAPFLLTNLLIDLLKKSQSSRIVNVASRVHSNQLNFSNLQFETGYTGVKAYARSKTCLILFTYLLADKLKNMNVTVNCLHPGGINTKLLRAARGYVGATLLEGAKTLIYAATEPELENVSGIYLFENIPTSSKNITYRKEVQRKLWETTEEILGIKFNKFEERW